ncbi:hypothetical protein K457DRAFT_400576 [Linnemannia elongata AG-77]|uniref:Uncharacterized protein n=1 Tax=Linnemannia elongata AG-77 TaxID=1314771 RepID=A0A197K2Y3_9FUNG|nr:hypothetical protein K457DRAFT_400576 [Linnemannia elongata AG-77]
MLIIFFWPYFLSFLPSSPFFLSSFFYSSLHPLISSSSSPYCLSSSFTFIVFFFLLLLHIKVDFSPSRTPSTNSTHTRPLEFDSHSSILFFLFHFGAILLTPPFIVTFTPHFFDLLSNTPHTYTYTHLILALAQVSL